jgi:hypothetical protein
MFQNVQADNAIIGRIGDVECFEIQHFVGTARHNVSRRITSSERSDEPGDAALGREVQHIAVFNGDPVPIEPELEEAVSFYRIATGTLRVRASSLSRRRKITSISAKIALSRDSLRRAPKAPRHPVRIYDHSVPKSLEQGR